MDAASLAADVAELAERFSVPGVACAVDVAGGVIEAHHGITHVEHPLDVDGGTLFQIASMSKPFAATVVMLLVHDGAVSLDDPLDEVERLVGDVGADG